VSFFSPIKAVLQPFVGGKYNKTESERRKNSPAEVLKRSVFASKNKVSKNFSARRAIFFVATRQKECAPHLIC
jgi:hypothetical protein